MCQTKEQGGRRCPACESVPTANRHNASRRAKSRGASIADLVAAAMNQDTSVIAEMADVAGIERGQLLEEVDKAEEAARPKTLRELMEQRKSEARAEADVALAEVQRREVAVDPDAIGTLWGSYGFAGPRQVRSSLDADRSLRMGLDTQMDQESKQWSDALNPAQARAVEEYTLTDYHTVNKSLRAYGSLNASDRQLVELLDAALETKELSETPVTVYRGVSCPPGLSATEWTAVDFQPGAEVEFPSYLSTSWDPSVAANFAEMGDAEAVVFEIKTRQGVPLSALSSFSDGERERLLPRQTVMRVVGVHPQVPFANRNGKIRHKTVVQLVEASALD